MVDNPWPMPRLDPPLQAVVDRLKGLSREQRSKAIAGILFWLELVEDSAAGRTASRFLGTILSKLRVPRSFAARRYICPKP
jgi:hypothetical protein